MRLPNRQVVEVVCGRQKGPNVALCGSQQHPAAERRIQGQNGSTGGKHARIRVVIVRRTGDLIEEFSQALMLVAEGRFGRHVELVRTDLDFCQFRIRRRDPERTFQPVENERVPYGRGIRRSRRDR